MCALAAVCGALLVSSVCRADTLLLANGGRIEGNWVNRADPPPANYIIETDTGIRLAVAAAQVAEIRSAKPAEREFLRISADYPDSPDGQWRLACWCLQHDLIDCRTRCLERILELSPHHAEARKALGYSWQHGRWMRPDEQRRKRGYVRYEGSWRMAPDVELAMQQRDRELQVKDWEKRLEKLNRQLRTEQQADALAEIRGIRDPLSVPALGVMAFRERSRPVARLWVETLGGIDSDLATQTLAVVAMQAPDIDVCDRAISQLKLRRTPELTAHFAAHLRSNENRKVNRAALILGDLQDPTAVSPLIDALVTRHWCPAPNPPKRITSAMPLTAPLGAALPAAELGTATTVDGKQQTVIWRTAQNPEVLRALVALAGDQGFGFRADAWRRWYNAKLNLRLADPALRRTPAGHVAPSSG